MPDKPTIEEIIHGSKHSIKLFSKSEVSNLEKDLYMNEKGKPYFKGVPGDRDRPAKPEEVVRQLFARRLNKHYGYPWERIKIEKNIVFGSDYTSNRADIVVMDKENKEAYIIVECKKPKRSDGREQLKSYCNAEGSPIGVWTNGSELLILYREDPNTYQSLSRIPTIDQSLADVLGESWT
ncbi:SAM-dependent methyltransferase, partial [bacterium]